MFWEKAFADCTDCDIGGGRDGCVWSIREDRTPGDSFVELRSVDGELPGHRICTDLCHV